MPGPLHELLRGEHARVGELLQRAVSRPDALDREAYASFRRSLLRHIGMEEKLLIPEALRIGSSAALRLVRQLRADHAVLAALLVPTPSHEIVRRIQEILREHDPLEEGPGGLYETCEQRAGGSLHELLERLRRFPEVRPAAHSDGARVHRRIEALLRARRECG